MRLPNGYGSVCKLSGKRRNPFRVRKTLGYELTENGRTKQIYQTIGYYPTRKAALEALAAYNADPYDVNTEKITFAEVYERWSEQHFETIVPSAVRTWKSAYRYCEPLYKMRMRDIRVLHLEQTIKNAKVGASTKARMKSLFNQLYRFAMKHENSWERLRTALWQHQGPKSLRSSASPSRMQKIELLWEKHQFSICGYDPDWHLLRLETPGAGRT